ncbi:MAG: replication-associated recombination protein A [Christensenellaceae bacterium]|jgi:putative ATPase|nr:replication-associated recombination protein A [Christensenellaceae bacterium]
MEMTTDFFARPPLAERMRPDSLEDFIGQQHIVGKNNLLDRAIRAGVLGSCIFYGPPGTGKTTLAHIIASTCKGEFRKLNAVSSGVADAKAVIDKAKHDFNLYGKQTYLLLDECHRWSKAQSDSVLQAIEEGSIIFIGSTTENPYTSMTRAIVSRCRVFEFKPLSEADLIISMQRAISDKKNGLGNLPVEVEDNALRHFAWAAAGDVRQALNALELAVNTTNINKQKNIVITREIAEQSIQKKALSLDETGYFDILSAFCKSIRGSDTEAALYYSQRLIKAGCDERIIARRLIAHCSEDIGMADSNALLLACAALQSCEKLGQPECLLNLSHAIIYACEAEKSNSVYLAMHAAADDAVNVKDDSVLNNLKNHPSTNDDGTDFVKWPPSDKTSADRGKSYKYPHDFGGYVKQQYMPNSLKDRVYYKPSNNGKEKGLVRKKERNK